MISVEGRPSTMALHEGRPYAKVSVEGCPFPMILHGGHPYTRGMSLHYSLTWGTSLRKGLG